MKIKDTRDEPTTWFIIFCLCIGVLSFGISISLDTAYATERVAGLVVALLGLIASASCFRLWVRHMIAGPYMLLLESMPDLDKERCLAAAKRKWENCAKEEAAHLRKHGRPSRKLAGERQSAMRRYELTEEAWERIVGTEEPGEEDKAARAT